MQVPETYYRMTNKDSNISFLLCSCVGVMSNCSLGSTYQQQHCLLSLRLTSNTALSASLSKRYQVISTVCVPALDVVKTIQISGARRGPKGIISKIRERGDVSFREKRTLHMTVDRPQTFELTVQSAGGECLPD